MLAAGVYLPPSGYEAWFLSAAHDSAALDRIAAALPAARARRRRGPGLKFHRSPRKSLMHQIFSLPFVPGEPFASSVEVTYTYKCDACKTERKLTSLGYSANSMHPRRAGSSFTLIMFGSVPSTK